MYQKIFSLIYILALLASPELSWAQDSEAPTEEDYYRMVTIPTPEGVLLEVGGLTTLPDGRIALSTRRGEDGFKT